MAENRYRKVEVRLWCDERFRALSSIPPSGQGLYIYLKTGPHTGPIPGVFRAGRAGLAEELGWPQEDFDRVFQEVSNLGMARADWRARLVFIPTEISSNLPQSPNVVASWAGEWRLLPECDLKLEAYAVLKATIQGLGGPFAKAFDKALGKSSAETVGKTFGKSLGESYGKTTSNQEQEQSQEQQERIEAVEPESGEGACAPLVLRGESHETEWAEIQRTTPTEAQVDAIYKLYPKKVGKIDAKKAIRKGVGIVIRGDAEHPAMLLDDALNYLQQRLTLYAQRVQGSEYIPDPATWFNKGRFWDDPSSWKLKGSSRKTNGVHHDGDDRHYTEGADIVYDNNSD